MKSWGGLVWPNQDREQYDRLLSEMADSSEPRSGTLPRRPSGRGGFADWMFPLGWKFAQNP